MTPPTPRPTIEPEDRDAQLAAWTGERLRRVALGATAALITARAYWPSEVDARTDGGTGLLWISAILAVSMIALAGAIIGGNLRFRWSWADACVITLVALVAISVRQAEDHRMAINLAFEFAGVGLAYLLVRNLPKTRSESVVLAGALAATAVAVAVYGLYQADVEIPELQRKYNTSANFKEQALQALGITPGTAAFIQFENRLLRSSDIYSTFGLANSLAGFLVGPLVMMIVVGWDNLTQRGGRGSRAGALLLALPPLLAVFICLVLTKSRSAYIGLAAAMLVIAWRERRRVRLRTLTLSALAAAVIVAGVIAAGLKTGRLDRLVLTETGKSLRFRLEYWIGSWHAINESSTAFWRGYGPGNFSPAYLRHKLPQASEEIIDPHNLFLEAWATAGVWAMLALVGAVVIGVGGLIWASLKAKPELDEFVEPVTTPPQPASTRDNDPARAPASATWLLVSAALGWVVVLLVGHIDLIGGGDFDRWLLLGGSWFLAVACGGLIWRRRPLDPFALGVAAVAVLVNLLAAGGLSVPTVALGLWTMVAIGMNLSEDRSCGRLRGPLGRVPAFAFAAMLAALIGSFYGSMTPYWKSEAAMAEAEDALSSKPPDYDAATNAYERATRLDRYSARAWHSLAVLDYQIWKDRGSKPDDLRWRKIPVEMLESVTKPRPTSSWSRHRERARMTRLLIAHLQGKIPPKELIKLQADVVHASRTATLLYPTSPALHAWLAEASADIGMTSDALKSGKEALRLDSITPHLDKKLEPTVRQWLESKIPDWEKKALPLEPKAS